MFWTCSYQRKGNCRSGQVLTFNFTYHRSNILVRHGCASSFDSPTCQATRSALAAASLQSRENMRKPASFSSPSFKICKFCVQPVSVVLLMIYTFGILRFQDSSLSNISVDIALLFWALAFLLAVKSHGNLWYIIYHSYWPIYAVICSRRSPNLLDVCGCMWADLKIAMAMGQSSILKLDGCHKWTVNRICGLGLGFWAIPCHSNISSFGPKSCPTDSTVGRHAPHFGTGRGNKHIPSSACVHIC